MRYGLHELDKHHAVTTTVAADRDEALEWFSEKLRLMLTFEGDPAAAEYLLDEWPESLPYNGTHSKPHHSGFRSQSSSCTPPGITRRWMWSDRCLSSHRLSRNQPGRESRCYRGDVVTILI